MTDEVYYPTRTLAARAAMRSGFIAFECLPVGEHWTFEGRKEGAGIELARTYAEGKDWINHCEITKTLTPILVVTCMREECDDDIPKLMQVLPVANSMWEPDRKLPPGKPTAREVMAKRQAFTLMEGSESPVVHPMLGTKLFS